MPATFTITRPVQFAETDMAGIVHFANYFRMMEEVEHAYFRSIGLSVSMQHDDIHVGWPRVSAGCEFFGPVKFEEEIELKMRVTRVGDKSFTYEVEFLLKGKRIALGKTTSVCCAVGNEMKSIPIPKPLRDRLEPGAAGTAV